MSTFDGEEMQFAAPLAPGIAVKINNDVVMMSCIVAFHVACSSYVEFV